MVVMVWALAEDAPSFQATNAATDRALTQAQPPKDSALKFVYSPDVDPTSVEFDTEAQVQLSGNEGTMVDLINRCLHEEMERNSRIVVLGEDVADAGRRAAQAIGAVGEASSLQMSPVDLVADAAWFAQMPGNWQWRPRDAKLSSRAFAALSSGHNFARGKRDGNPPVVRLHSECLTGDVFGSRRCDCGPQLDAAMAMVAVGSNDSGASIPPI